MICKTCQAEGKKSYVYNRGGSGTLLMWNAFYDEEGKHHVHDPNTTTYGYECSNGHTWSEEEKHGCWCGWPQKPEPKVQHQEPPADKNPFSIVATSPGDNLVTLNDKQSFSICASERVKCPKCGHECDADAAIRVSVPGISGRYCDHCFGDWISKNIPKMEPVKPESVSQG